MNVADLVFEVTERKDCDGKPRLWLSCRHGRISGTGFAGYVEIDDLKRIGKFFNNEAEEKEKPK